jgi:hypothetical protein
VIRHCTAQSPFLAQGIAVYGGFSNLVEDCLTRDITASCGILVSTTFPTSDESRKIDNNFSETTVIRNCEVLRCGGYDHEWGWRGSLQICLDRRSIAGLTISGLKIKDSISDGIMILAPGSKNGQGTLSNARLERVDISNYGIGLPGQHGLFIDKDVLGSLTVVNSKIPETQNNSAHFSINTE